MIAKRFAGAARLRGALLLIGVALLLLLARVALAESEAGLDLFWNTVDGGGGTFSTGGAYSLGGTAGQPDAGLLTGGIYTVDGGFWGGGAAGLEYALYLPLVVRGQ
jgi:hypothetical protein